MHPNEVAKEFINKPVSKYDGIYYGEVVDIEDPDHLGRVKVAVYNVLDSFQKSDIPWAFPQSSFIGSNTGSFIIPPKGSVINVMFQNGDIHLPIYLSTKMHFGNTLPKGKSGVNDPKNIIFYETDDGDYFEINQKTKETIFKHSSGTNITIAKDGTVQIHAIKIIDAGKSLATPATGPSNLGHYCAIVTCPYTGLFHVGNTANAMIPPIG